MRCVRWTKYISLFLNYIIYKLNRIQMVYETGLELESGFLDKGETYFFETCIFILNLTPVSIFQ